MNRQATKVQAAQIFLKAAAYIRRYGWQEKGMGEYGKPRCSMGALASAYPKTKWDKDLAKLMYETLYRELRGLDLTQFNRTYRDGEKVARLFEQTAAALAKQHSRI